MSTQEQNTLRLRQKLWFWWLRNFCFERTYELHNDRMDAVAIGEVYIETSQQYYIKIGKHHLWIKKKQSHE